MSITEIMQWKSARGRIGQLSIMLAMHSAPLLRGSKISNIVTIKKEDYAVLRELLVGSGISYRLLKSAKGKVILFLYRKEVLERYLASDEIKNYLTEMGYDFSDGSLSVLSQLARRIFFYKHDKVSYPHEIGIFLGYPLEDVKGFVADRGRNPVYCGYWKVYGDVDKAKRMFAKYESDKETAVRAIMNGASIRDIAV